MAEKYTTMNTPRVHCIHQEFLVIEVTLKGKGASFFLRDPPGKNTSGNVIIRH